MKPLLTATLLLIASFFATSLELANVETHPVTREELVERLPVEARVASLGYEPEWMNRTGTATYWRRPAPAGVSGVRYAVHVAQLSDASGANWKFRILDERNVVKFELKAGDVTEPDFWTPDLVAGKLIFEVVSDRKPDGLTFTLDKWAVAGVVPAVRSILNPGDPKLESILNYKDQAKYWSPSRAVAKLRILKDDQFFACTGFLIGGDLLLTNDHCIPEGMAVRTPGACRNVIEVMFDYDKLDSKVTSFPCTELVQRSKDLDYAVLRIGGNARAKYGKLVLDPVREPVAAATDPLFIIQHPGGRPTAIAVQRCRADAVGVPGVAGRLDKQDFRHLCDTEGGSSGSPVMDGAGKVVGLHHFGFLPNATVRKNRAVLMRLVVDDFANDVKAALAN